LFLRFFVRPGKPVSSSRPTNCRMLSCAGGCQGWPVAPTLPCTSKVARPCLDSYEHDGTLGMVGSTIARGARCRARLLRAATLYSVGRNDPNHDARMRIGGEAPRRQAHSAQRHESQGFRGSPPPRIVIGDPCSNGLSRNCRRARQAGRMTTPSGTTPSRTNRHRAIKSLRARATIMVLRDFGAFSVRRWYH
jgi:hypothetical protein